MPHISKKKLDEKFINDLFLEIVSIFDRAGRRGELRGVLYEILTPTEKVMLAKRLAVVNMLDKMIPIHDIAESLHMSPSTIDIMSLKFETGHYKKILESGFKKTDINDVIRILQTAGGIMPSISGRGRWKGLDDSLRKARINKRFQKLTEKNKNKKQSKS